MTKLIPILSGRCLVVEMQEGAHSPVVDDYLLGFNLPAPKWAGDWSDDSYDTIDLPPGNWRIIGMLSEVTESEAANLVEKGADNRGNEFGYHDYLGLFHNVRTALESLESAILVEGYLLETPPAPKCGCHGPSDLGACDGCDEWVELESRVLDRSRCLLLRREEEI